MPIALEDLPPPQTESIARPRLWLWLLVLVVCLLIGLAVVILLWPAGKPTMTGAWWSWAVAYPLSVYAGLLGLRWFWHDRAQNRVADWNADREQALSQEIARGQQPVRLYGMAYVTPLGIDALAPQLATGASAVAARPIEGVGHVVCAPFPRDLFGQLSTAAFNGLEPDYDSGWDGAPGEPDWAPATDSDVRDAFPPEATAPLVPKAKDWLLAIYHHVIAMHGPVLRTLSGRHRRWCVALAVNPALTGLDPANVWQAACRDMGLATPAPILIDEGLMVLDRWLDTHQTGRRLLPTLLVSVTCCDVPSAGSGEGAVAVLIGADDARDDMPAAPIARLHRPEQLGRAGNTVAGSLEHALTWSALPTSALDQVWLSSLDRDAQIAVLAALPQLALAVTDHPQIDVSSALGNSGISSGWLTLVAAIEHGQQTGKAQLVVAADPQPVALVVEPLETNMNELA